MAVNVVIFYFDKAIIECDSDPWVVDGLGLTDLFKSLLDTMPLNALMDKLMGVLHSQGKSVEDIADCLKRAPLHSPIVSAIKTAYSLGCDLRIVSNANLFFVETILKHYGLIECFSEINTNPSFVDENGRLRIIPYHDFHTSPHGCNLCPPNKCKGLIIERIHASVFAEKKRFIYIGNGSTVFCLSQKLEEGDKLMPRKNFPLWDLVYENPLLLKAKIHGWSNVEELEDVLLQLIRDSISIEDDNNFSKLVDCKSHLPIIHIRPFPSSSLFLANPCIPIPRPRS